MNTNGIDARTLRRCLETAAAAIAAKESHLNALDSAIGDGDHGITMRTGFEAVTERLAALTDDAGLEEVLKEAGSAFMGATGGAIGVLLGGMFMAGGTALAGRSEIGINELKLLLEAMEASLVRIGKAKPGDKTILDAVHAACRAVAGTNSSEVDKAVLTAAEAAAAGAQMTANMLCAKGRASRLGERVLGHPDPGAVSFSLILQAFTECLERGSCCSGG
jgi:dihydroxyacetone kinase phosphoprotein-dependent L subunit